MKEQIVLPFRCIACDTLHDIFPATPRGYYLHCTCGRTYRIVWDKLTKRLMWLHQPRFPGDTLTRQRGFGGGAPIRGRK